MTSGYSGTPLAKKLGVVDGQRTWRTGMPESVAEEIALGDVVPTLMRAPGKDLQMAHLFVTRRGDLAAKLGRVRGLLAANGMVWVSWPKKASKVTTDITEDIVRAEAFALGMVDVKVCAVNEVWSGLKLVIRGINRVK